MSGAAPATAPAAADVPATVPAPFVYYYGADSDRAYAPRREPVEMAGEQEQQRAEFIDPVVIAQIHALVLFFG